MVVRAYEIVSIPSNIKVYGYRSPRPGDSTTCKAVITQEVIRTFVLNDVHLVG